MKAIYHVLSKLGLSEKESTVYLECLKHESVIPYQIAHATKIPRTTIYDILMSLSLKGLVEIQSSDGLTKQQTIVRATNPSIFRSILEKKRVESYRTEAELIEVLPALRNLFHEHTNHSSDFEFFPGIEGVKHVYSSIDFNDVPGEELIWTKLMPMDVFGSDDVNSSVQAHNLMRIKQNSHAKELIPLNNWTKHVLTYQYQLDNNYLKTRKFRYIEAPFFEIFLDIVIKGDFVKAVCTEGDEVWGIIIKSNALAKSLQSIYNFMWNFATPISEDILQSWGKNLFLEEQRKTKM